MAGCRPDFAYAPSVICKAQPCSQSFVHDHSSGQTVGLAKNYMVGPGVMWPENPNGLPSKARFHKMPVEDGWWWFRHQNYPLRNPNTKYFDGEFRSFVPKNTMEKCSFGKDARRLVGKRYVPCHESSRKVFAQLAKQQGLSEETVRQYQEEEGFRRDMHRNYARLMKGPALPAASDPPSSAGVSQPEDVPTPLQKSASCPGPKPRTKVVVQSRDPTAARGLMITSGGLGESWFKDYV